MVFLRIVRRKIVKVSDDKVDVLTWCLRLNFRVALANNCRTRFRACLYERREKLFRSKWRDFLACLIRLASVNCKQ